jgi:hypothetical protein
LTFYVYDANGRRSKEATKLLVYTARICYRQKEGLKKWVRNVKISDEWIGGIAG